MQRDDRHILLNTTVGGPSAIRELDPEALQQNVNAMGRLAEDLLLYDRVLVLTNSFENLSLFLMWMHASTLEELIEHEVLGFVRAPGTIGYISRSASEELRMSTIGLVRIVGTQHKDGSPHIQTLPSEAAAERVLKESTTWDRTQVVAQARKIAGATYDFDTKQLEEAVIPETWRDVQSHPQLRDTLGLHPEDWDELDDAQAQKLLRVADVNEHLCIGSAIAVDNLHNDVLAEPVLKAKLEPLLHKKRSKEWRELCRVRRLPDVASLVISGQLSFSDVCRIRRASGCVRFRRWLHSQSEEEPSEEIVSAYIDALSVPRLADRPIVKAARFLVTSALSLIPEIGEVLGTAASLADSFVVDRILEGWTPDVFLDKEYGEYIAAHRAVREGVPDH